MDRHSESNIELTFLLTLQLNLIPLPAASAAGRKLALRGFCVPR